MTLWVLLKNLYLHDIVTESNRAVAVITNLHQCNVSPLHLGG